MYPHHTGVNFTSTTNSEDTITVTWSAATSPYCGGILYYVVMISDENSNIMNDTVNALTATFSNLMNDTNYTVTVTAYNRVVAGMTTPVNIRTSSPVPTQSNNTSNNGNNSASDPNNNRSTYVCIT